MSPGTYLERLCGAITALERLADPESLSGYGAANGSSNNTREMQARLAYARSSALRARYGESTMTQDEAAEVLIEALKLKRERVTAPTVGEKQKLRDEYKRVISAMQLWQERHEEAPAATYLAVLLGEDDARVRDALKVWPG